MKFSTKPMRHYPSQLRHVATLPRDIKNSKVCRYSADIEGNINKLHFKCTNFISSTRVTVILSEFMCFYQNLVLVAVYHVDC